MGFTAISARQTTPTDVDISNFHLGADFQIYQDADRYIYAISRGGSAGYGGPDGVGGVSDPKDTTEIVVKCVEDAGANVL
jgi:hypothetical protein